MIKESHFAVPGARPQINNLQIITREKYLRSLIFVGISYWAAIAIVVLLIKKKKRKWVFLTQY